MKIRRELAKTNSDLLQAATSFKFHDIFIKVIQVPGSKWVEIHRAGKVYDKSSGSFVNLVNNYAVADELILDSVDYQFKDVYEAFDVVMGMIKK